MEDHILIRYGELSLKKTNRRQFVTKVTNHIKRSLSEFKDLAYESRGMRFYVILNNTPSEPIIEKLQKIPGVYSFSVVSRTESKLDAICKLAEEIVRKEIGTNATFKVETNRADKTLELNSMQISAKVGGRILKANKNLKVDIKNPNEHATAFPPLNFANTGKQCPAAAASPARIITFSLSVKREVKKIAKVTFKKYSTVKITGNGRSKRRG